MKPIGSNEPWSGGTVTPWASCVLAPNPSPLTLDGTNTWILGAPRAEDVAIVDPGPADSTHLDRVRQEVAARGCGVAAVLLTHGHPDHADAAAMFAGAFGARILVPGQPASGSEDDVLTGGDVVAVSGLTIEVVATPGHSSDSVSLLLSAQSALLTGDTVLGRGTTVVAHPDGSLADYLQSLETLKNIVISEGVSRILPGHGPVLTDPASVLTDYIEHRRERLDQVREAVRAGARTTSDVVEAVYQPIPPQVVPAAAASARAQLAYLAELGEI